MEIENIDQLIEVAKSAEGKKIKEFDIKIDRKIAEKNRLREIATSTGGTGDGERVQTSIKRDKLGDTVAKIIDTEKEIDRMIDIYVSKKQERRTKIEFTESTNRVKNFDDSDFRCDISCTI